MTTTTNMQLALATVSQTLGPEWAQLLNAIFSRIDLHDHSTGNGAKVTPAGMLVNAALDFVGNALLNAKYLGIQSQAATDTTATGSLQRIGTNLYWINAAGAAVQITSGTSVVSTGSGALTVSVPSSYPYSVGSGDAQKVLIVDSAAARTLNLPAATNAMYVLVKDGAGQAATNNITIAPNGTDLIDGANANFALNENHGSVGLISDGVSKWYVI